MQAAVFAQAAPLQPRSKLNVSPLPIVPGVVLAEEVFETIRLVVGEPHDSDGFSVAPLPLPHWLVHR